MSRHAAPLLLAALAPLLVAADKPVLVPDISARKVEIRYSFTGAQLLLFGAIVYPGGRPPSRPADIVVVLRGPVQPILVREKQRIPHIWMNADSNRFRSAPSFYSVASSRPISELVDERTAAIYEMGLHNLQLSPGGGALPEKERRFEAGLLDLRRRHGLYAENPRGVEISDRVLYRATITIPSQVPVGTYTAETFLVDRPCPTAGPGARGGNARHPDRQVGLRAVRRARRPASRGILRIGRRRPLARPRLGGRGSLPSARL